MYKSKGAICKCQRWKNSHSNSLSEDMHQRKAYSLNSVTSGDLGLREEGVTDCLVLLSDCDERLSDAVVVYRCLNLQYLNMDSKSHSVAQLQFL